MRHEIVVPKKLSLYYSEQSEQNGANGQEEYRSRRAQINKQDDFAEKNYKVLLHESKEDNLCLSLSQRLSFCRETEHAIKHDDRSLHVKETWVKSFNSFGCFSGINLKVPKFFEFWVALSRPSTRNKTRTRVSLMDFCPWTLCMKWCWVILGSWISSLVLTRTWMRKVKTGISE